MGKHRKKLVRHATPKSRWGCPKVKGLYRRRDLLTTQTGIEWTVDHILPLSAGGPHVWENLRLLPRSLNCAKADHIPEWDELPRPLQRFLLGQAESHLETKPESSDLQLTG